jgi:hypothetical protein
MSYAPFAEVDLTLLESDEDNPFVTPQRLPTLKPAEKKRRVSSTFLGTPANLFPDISSTKEKCMFCESKGVTSVFGKFPMCNICSPHTLGVPLDHPKIKLITDLRKEVKDFENTRRQFVGRNTVVGEIDRRIREIQKTIVILIDHQVDLTTL